MGLSEPRKRRKIDQDPNNTAWTRSTHGYGHKILSAQGWRPGGSLGASDAQHSAHYTTASVVPISVLLKDDNLGLGAKSHKSPDEKFGLDIFQDVLGRLNGRSDGVEEKARRERAERKTRVYAAQKFGLLQFVRGGFLIGDDITPHGVESESPEAASSLGRTRISSIKDEYGHAEEPAQGARGKTSSSQTSDARLTLTETVQDETVEEVDWRSRRKEEKRQRKAERKQRELGDGSNNTATSHKHKPSRENRGKAKEKSKRDKRLDEVSPDVTVESAKAVLDQITAAEPPSETDSSLDIQADVDGRVDDVPKVAEAQLRIPEKSHRRAEQGADAPTTHVGDTDAGVAESARHRAAPGGRQAARRRYIQHKRLAFQDPKALREILMSR